MRHSVNQCIEQLEAVVLELEASPTPENVRKALDALALNRLRLPSAQVMALFDLLEDGITPISEELVTALLMICETYKRLLCCLAGVLDRPLSDFKPAAEEAPEAAEAEAPEAEPEDHKPDEAEDKPATAPLQQPAGISAIRVPTDKLDRLFEQVGRLMVTYAVVTAQQKAGAQLQAAGLRELDGVIDQLRAEVENIRMVPLKQILAPMHRLVKSLTQKMGKKVRFEVVGDDMELDKMIVECLNEPLVHLLRNAVDHGVETPEEREQAGKPGTGTIRLAANRRGEHAYLRIEDDGRGLDPERIQAKAREQGLWEEGREYSEQDIYRFVLRSGFSTAKEVTDVSGRGVGMDAVVNAIRDSLDGEVDIASRRGQGSVFTISIPLSRSVNEGIVDALVTQVAKETFLVPSREVLEVYQLSRREVVDLMDDKEAVEVRGEMVPLIRLGRYLGLNDATDGEQGSHAIVVKAGERKAALLVDDVFKQQQVVVTNFTVPLQTLYQAPILGYGMMGESDALVINVEQLLEQLGVGRPAAESGNL